MAQQITANILKPELVSPAGDRESLITAVKNGADAVYFGVKGLSMRNMAKNFHINEMKKNMDFLKKHNKKGYLALNVLIYDSEIKKIEKIVKKAKEAGVDAVICWDMAVAGFLKENGIKMHLSTQASVSNFAAVKYYYQQGAERIVLARECSLTDIIRIKQRIKKEGLNCQIEAFIHGAMCLSVSGRCLLSEYAFSKSANRGECYQPCRREFMIKDVQDKNEYVLGEHYILSSKDLCTIDFIDRLLSSGIDALKIEGRMRSPEYVGAVTKAYRTAINAFFSKTFDDKLKTKLKKRLKTFYNRGFTSGFYFKKQNATGGIAKTGFKKEFLGEVTKFYKKLQVAEIKIKNAGVALQNTLLISGKNTPADFFEVKEMQVNKKFIKTAVKGQSIGIKTHFKVRRNDKVFLITPKKDSL